MKWNGNHSKAQMKNVALTAVTVWNKNLKVVLIATVNEADTFF
jgi:hypothetical protein